ncbi:tat pathway signal sequence, partial [Pyrenophora tritici-repentis]
GGSIARQQPNPDSDAIWDEWELTRVYPATREDIIKMGTDPSTVAKLKDDVWGLGDDAYATIFDVYHQIHCLNSLRHIAYSNYYNLSMARVHTVKQREIHLNHCIDILLQGIQCNANLDLIPLHWVETQEYPFPDMSINKKCVNFDGLTEWRKANTVDMDKYVKVMKMPEVNKPGVKELPAADQYYEYWGFDNPNHKPEAEGGHGLPMDVDSNL